MSYIEKAITNEKNYETEYQTMHMGGTPKNCEETGFILTDDSRWLVSAKMSKYLGARMTFSNRIAILSER